MNKINYTEIKNFLEKNNLTVHSDLSDNDYFNSLSSITSAKKNDLTFFIENNNKELLKNSLAKACLITKKNVNLLSKNTDAIIVDDPYNAFALITNLFKNNEVSNGKISNLAFIDNRSKLSNNVQIDSFTHIKEACEIGTNVIIESNCSIGPNVKIYENTVIKSNSVLSNCEIGSNCIIKSGAIIGGTGFGFHPVTKSRIQHLGNVIIEENCNIGSNTTIDRAALDSTIISKNSFIDNLVQIAHNVIIGSGAIIAAQSGIAGSTQIGKNVLIGGQVGISGHIKIGNNVTIAAKSGVTKNLKDNSVVAGFPAIDIKKWKLMNIKLNKKI